MLAVHFGLYWFNADGVGMRKFVTIHTCYVDSSSKKEDKKDANR